MARKRVISTDEDIPGQMFLPFAPLAGQSFELTLRVDYPRSTAPEVTQRLQRVGKRLSRGAVAHDWKVRKMVDDLEALAGLFDGVR